MARGEPNTAMDGCSGFAPDHLAVSISNIQLVCEKAKSCSNPTNRVAAAVFPQQKTTGSVLADPRVFPHLSSSPDLRINSSAWPSQVAPMTGFRLMQNLHAYSGGTVRESHPVFYSPVKLLPLTQALKRNIYLPHKYIRLHKKSQWTFSAETDRIGFFQVNALQKMMIYSKE